MHGDMAFAMTRTYHRGRSSCANSQPLVRIAQALGDRLRTDHRRDGTQYLGNPGTQLPPSSPTWTGSSCTMCRAGARRRPHGASRRIAADQGRSSSGCLNRGSNLWISNSSPKRAITPKTAGLGAGKVRLKHQGNKGNGSSGFVWLTCPFTPQALSGTFLCPAMPPKIRRTGSDPHKSRNSQGNEVELFVGSARFC